MSADMFEEAYKSNPTVFGTVPSPGLDDLIRGLVASRALSALDLGCGQGRDTLYLLSSGFTVTAVDQAASGIAALRAQVPPEQAQRLDPIVANVFDFSRWQGDYDLIVGTTILDHLPSDDGRRLLRHAASCLRPQGVVYMCVHTVDDPGFTKTGHISEFAGAIAHYFEPNELIRWVIDLLTVVKYECRIETDYDHGPVHQHGMAYLIARRGQ